jgi:hypothetical protein
MVGSEQMMKRAWTTVVAFAALMLASCGPREQHARIEFVSCKQDGEYFRCQMRAVNNTGHALSYPTQLEKPFPDLEKLVDGKWQGQGGMICFIGFDRRSLPSGGSVEWTELVSSSGEPIRIGLGFRTSDTDADDQVWSEVTPLPALSPKRR